MEDVEECTNGWFAVIVWLLSTCTSKRCSRVRSIYKCIQFVRNSVVRFFVSPAFLLCRFFSFFLSLLLLNSTRINRVFGQFMRNAIKQVTFIRNYCETYFEHWMENAENRVERMRRRNEARKNKKNGPRTQYETPEIVKSQERRREQSATVKNVRFSCCQVRWNVAEVYEKTNLNINKQQ